jgi:cystathionine gamma-synthase
MPESFIHTDAIHAGHAMDPAYGAVAMPIVLSTTFERGEEGQFIEGRDIYARASNPNRRAVEAKLAALEGGLEGICFSSGQAATNAVFHSLQSGDHIIIPDDIYYGTKVLLDHHYQRWGLQYSQVDQTDLQQVDSAIQANTRLIWIETPSNPLLKITDLEGILTLTRPRGILTACDNTWASAYYSSPLALGIDLVMHSTTKYFSGHSDLTGGCILSGESSAISQRIRDYQILGGAVPSAFDSWLLDRSLATYPLRMKLHGENAMILAQYLSHHPKIEKVLYPGLKSNMYHAIAEKQMQRGFGGMLSIIIKGGAEASLALASALKLVKHATSLGGVESLVDHRRTAEGIHGTSPANLLRISVGLENIEDLIRDFEQALHNI